MWSIAYITCFSVDRPLGHPPGELFFVTNKNHSKPLGKGHRINDKQRLPGVKYEHPQHNIEVWLRNEIKWHEKALLYSDIPLTKTRTNLVGMFYLLGSRGCPGGQPTGRQMRSIFNRETPRTVYSILGVC